VYLFDEFHSLDFAHFPVFKSANVTYFYGQDRPMFSGSAVRVEPTHTDSLSNVI
jgi:hypothetical protein